MSTANCKNCENRHLACHDTCDIYQRNHKEHAKKKEWLRKMDGLYKPYIHGLPKNFSFKKKEDFTVD